MLRITKQTDYGIVLLSRMAAEPARQWSAPELGAEAQLPLPTVSKILKLLAKDAILASHRGVKGGYSLSRAPEAITVAEVIACLEGPIAMTECIDEATDCSQVGHCPQQANWQVINQAVRRALEGITLREMAIPMPAAQRPAPLVQLPRRRLSAVPPPAVLDLLARTGASAK